MRMIILLVFSGMISQCQTPATGVSSQSKSTVTVSEKNYSRAYFAAGCFWCVEAIFESLLGVEEVISGYAGGSAEDADYRKVASGITDHAETVEIFYDTSVISYQTLLKVFFDSHDPTTLNRQGPDRGRQYRSAVFYKNDTERQLAEDYISSLETLGVFPKGSITTELAPFTAFYPAEDYHQDYERLNPYQPYIQNVSIPRLKKFQAKNPDLLKNKD